MDADTSVGRSQAITDPRFSENVLWTFGVGLDLLSQLPHIDSQILSVSQIIPQLPEQKLVGQDLAGMLHQNSQEFIFFRR